VEREARLAAEKALADLKQQIEDQNKTAEEKAAETLAAAQKAAAERWHNTRYRPHCHL